MTVVGSTLFFSGQDSNGDVELWAHDTSNHTTWQVANINTLQSPYASDYCTGYTLGIGDNPHKSSFPDGFYTIGDTAYFFASNGYYDRELTKNALDWKELYDVGPSFGHCIPQWPRHPERFRPVIEAFAKQCHQIALQLVSGLAQAMNTNPSQLLQGFDEHTSFLRLNYYPTCEDPAPPSTPTGDSSKQLGISHHSDAGAVTVLMVDGQDGLQVERDGQWFTVETKPLSIVVNIGDMVQVWSNDRYTAPLHRVLASEVSTRYSAPYFLNPSFATSYAPLNAMCQDERPRYKEINWGAFREGRAAGDYADVGDEIQIAHYRVVP